MVNAVEIRVDSYSANNNTGLDLIPHTFLVVTGPDGVEHGYGFAPVKTGLFGTGYIQDDTRHPYDGSSGKLSITDEQYNHLMEYIERTSENPPPYALLFGSQCTNWALAGLAEASIIPSILGPKIEPNNILIDFIQTLIFNPIWQKIGFEVNETVDKIKAFLATASTTISPIILDLDGDGVETTGVKSGAYFDHGGDGFAEQTGWAGKDDGMLARDLNGNDRLLGGEGDDTLIDTNGNDWIDGGQGNDVIQDWGGNNTLLGGDGNDSIVSGGWSGSNLIDGGAGNDSIQYSFYTSNTILGGADDDYIRTDGFQSAGTSNTFVGGTGNDTFWNGYGADTYVFSRGDGQDVITDTGGNDVLKFVDVLSDQIWLSRSGNNLDIAVLGDFGKVTVQGWFDGDTNHIEQIRTADGKFLYHGNVQGVIDALAPYGTPALELIGLTPDQSNAVDSYWGLI